MAKFLVSWASVETIQHSLEVEAVDKEEAEKVVRQIIHSHGETSVDFVPIEDDEVVVAPLK